MNQKIMENSTLLNCCVKKLLNLLKTKCSGEPENKENQFTDSGDDPRTLQIQIPAHTKELFVFAVLQEDGNDDGNLSDIELCSVLEPCAVKVNTSLLLKGSNLSIRSRGKSISGVLREANRQNVMGYNLPVVANKLIQTSSFDSPTYQKYLGTYLCEACGDCFDTYADFESHKDKKHMLVEVKTEDIEDPLASVSDDMLFVFKCESCAKYFSDLESLKQHECGLPLECQMEVCEEEVCIAGQQEPECTTGQLSATGLQGPECATGKLQPECATGQLEPECATGGLESEQYAKEGGAYFETGENQSVLFMPNECEESDVENELVDSLIIVEDAGEDYVSDCDAMPLKLIEDDSENDSVFSPNITVNEDDDSTTAQSNTSDETPRKKAKLDIENQNPENVPLKLSYTDTKCPFCGKQFAHNYQLRSHLIAHQKERPFKCTMCSNAFKTEKMLSSHVKLHGEKTLACKVCSKKFVDKENLDAHLEKHGKMDGTMYKCRFCVNSFEDLGTLKQHYTSEHPVPSFYCVACQRSFADLVNRCRHFREEHEGMHQSCCRLCGNIYLNQTGLQIHLREHEVKKDDGTYVYSCCNCGKTYASGKNLASHSQIHNSQPPFVCVTCQNSFPTARDLEKHFPEHEKLAELKNCPKCCHLVANLQLHACFQPKHHCPVCKKLYKTATSLQVHLYSHSPQKLPKEPGKSPRRHKPYKCLMCRKTFFDHNPLMLHLYSFHKSPCYQKQYNCTQCRREFTTQANLTNHLRTHKEGKPLRKAFSCEVCQRTFTTKAHQIIHMQLHTSDEKVCPVCSKRYTTVEWLQFHMRTHTGEGYACNVCDKVFGAEVTLKLHAKTHEDKSSALNCCLCEEIAGTKALLLEHMRMKHGEVQPRICEKCQTGFPIKVDYDGHLAGCGGRDENKKGNEMGDEKVVEKLN